MSAGRFCLTSRLAGHAREAQDKVTQTHSHTCLLLLLLLALLVCVVPQEKAQIESTMLKRLGTPQDIAGAVAFLSSEDAGYMTGETLVVAGGMQSRL